MKHFSLQLVKRKLSKKNRNLKFKSKSILTENNAKRQSWCRESFAEDHKTTPTYVP